jgi:hypothetical protein
MKFLFIFILVIFVDFIWTACIFHISKNNAIKASFYSVLLTLIGNIVTIIYVEDHWMIIPSALGAFIGTFLSVKLNKINN